MNCSFRGQSAILDAFASQVPRVPESGEQLAEAHRLLARAYFARADIPYHEGKFRRGISRP